MKESNYSKTFDTGDINFTAAAMSMGFPLNEVKPCSVIQRDNGKNYTRFHLLVLSMDGTIEIGHISSWWTDPSDCYNQAFSNIMDMIKAGLHVGGIKSSKDWLDFTIDYLTGKGINQHPTNMADIPDFIDRVGEHTLEAQLCSFAFNREFAFQIIKESKRAIMLTHGRDSHARIDEALPKWQRNELLARLRG